MFWKTLAAVFLIVVVFIGYSFLQFRSELHVVYDAPPSYAVTPAQYDLTVVEFVDYGCQFSKSIHPKLKQAINQDGHVKHIIRPLVHPDLPEGREALLFLYAAGLQGAFDRTSEKLFEIWPVRDMQVLMDFAKAEGLDGGKIETDMQSPEVQSAVDQNMQYYEAWKFQSTPTIMIATPFLGTKAIYRAGKDEPSVREFTERFNLARQWF